MVSGNVLVCDAWAHICVVSRDAMGTIVWVVLSGDITGDVWVEVSDDISVGGV